MIGTKPQESPAAEHPYGTKLRKSIRPGPHKQALDLATDRHRHGHVTRKRILGAPSGAKSIGCAF
ncbi:hypothetical protein GCM10023321_80580 [Pseudonocardia eucalypti]|uniref:Uncharacterized protein n=1 Tax=Pseudonocardia eucalypti TaxID=648755 RepID=A0ABP9RDI4_9PSEU